MSNTIICHILKGEHNKARLEQLASGVAEVWNTIIKPLIWQRKGDERKKAGESTGPLRSYRALHEICIMEDVAAHIVPGGDWES